MQTTKLKNFRFLVAREAGHTQIVTGRAASRVEALEAVCIANPGCSVERYSKQLAQQLNATAADRHWAGARYQHGSAFDPETWNEGDIIIDRRGDRSLITAPLPASGYLPMLHLSPGNKHDLQPFSLHVSVLTNTYGYRLEGQAVSDHVPSFDGAAMNDPTFDTADDIRSMIENS